MLEGTDLRMVLEFLDGRCGHVRAFLERLFAREARLEKVVAPGAVAEAVEVTHRPGICDRGPGGHRGLEDTMHEMMVGAIFYFGCNVLFTCSLCLGPSSTRENGPTPDFSGEEGGAGWAVPTLKVPGLHIKMNLRHICAAQRKREGVWCADLERNVEEGARQHHPARRQRVDRHNEFDFVLLPVAHVPRHGRAHRVHGLVGDWEAALRA